MALANSVLASECPAAAILSALSVAIGIEVELTDLPKVLGIDCSLERAANEGKTVRAERLRVEINLYLTCFSRKVGGFWLLVEGEECK